MMAAVVRHSIVASIAPCSVTRQRTRSARLMWRQRTSLPVLGSRILELTVGTLQLVELSRTLAVPAACAYARLIGAKRVRHAGDGSRVVSSRAPAIGRCGVRRDPKRHQRRGQ